MRNYSKQREEILEVLKEPGLHLTAEDIYNKVKLIDSTISMATVYRNLNELIYDGIIWKISSKDGKMRYDYSGEKHNHIICLRCGKVKDFKYEFNSNQDLMDSLNKQMYMNFELKTVTIYGICNECKLKI